MHSDHTSIARIVSVHHSFTHKSITDRRIHDLRKFSDFPIGTGDHCAAANIDKRFLRIAQQRQRFLQLFLGIAGRLTWHLRFFSIICTAVRSHILCDIYQHRTRSTASRNSEGPAKRVGQDRHIFNDIIMLRDRHGDTGDVYLLKGILAKRRKHDITSNSHHRY